MKTQTLGIGRIITVVFGILMLRFQLLATIAATAVVLEYLANLVMDSLMPASGIGDAPIDFARVAATYIIDSIASAFVSALVIQLTYDLMLERSSDTTNYLDRAKQCIVPIVLVSTLSGLAVGLASMAFIIPGLILATMWFVIVPVIVIENSGMKAFSRSAELTKGHRWPVFGIVLLLTVPFIGFSVLIDAAISGYPVISEIVLWMFTGFIYLLSALAAAVVYARLRELKEGVSVDDLANVFS